jgi:hypothetical protein
MLIFKSFPNSAIVSLKSKPGATMMLAIEILCPKREIGSTHQYSSRRSAAQKGKSRVERRRRAVDLAK